MTDQEAINEIRSRECVECIGNEIGCGSCSYMIAIKALEEIQQYRAIGTLDELNSLIAQSEEEFNMLIEYISIGTVEECRAAVERQKAKKPHKNYEKFSGVWCSCGSYLGVDKPNYCSDCGQKLDWRDE